MLTNYLGLVTVRNQHQLTALAIQTYILGVITGVVFIIIAAIIANSIKFEGGANAKDPAKRRLWFWILLFVCFSSFFLYNLFFVAIRVQSNLQNRFITANITGSVIALVTYFVLGFILSKMFSTSKIGNWFKSR